MDYSLITLALALSLIHIFSLCKAELIGVIQVNRHGARTGKHYADFTKNFFFGSSETQLTINGLKQQEALGQWISERYITHDYQLLSKDYNKKEMIIRASPFERTIFSASNFIKGLYPISKIVPVFKGNEESTRKMKNDDIPPIPGFKLRQNIPEIEIIVEDPDLDNVFHAGTCRIESSSQKTVKDLLVRQKIFNYTREEIIDALEDIKSQWAEPFLHQKEEIYKLQFLKRINAFIDPTQYHYVNGFFKLTEKTNALLKKIQIEKWYAARLIDSMGLRLTVSGFFSEFVNYLDIFTKRVEGKLQNNHEFEKLKYVLYSGHDSSIISFFTNLLSIEKLTEMIADVDNHYHFLQPNFASHFIIELHSVNLSNFLSETNKYFIKLIYNGEEIKDGLHKDLPYDNNLKGIDFNSFKEFLEKRIDENFKNLYCKRKETIKEKLLNEAILELTRHTLNEGKNSMP